MKIVAIIPSRYNSSRFVGKPLKLICGVPMIQRVYEKVVKSNQISDVYVATDNEKIKKVVADFGGKVIMTSSSHKSGTDRVYEAVTHLNLNKEDLIINIQGDQPLVNTSCINDLIKPFFEKKESIRMTTLAFLVKDGNKLNNSKDVKVVFDFNGYALYFSRSMIPYYRESNNKALIFKHLGLYAYKKEFLKIFSSLPEGELESIEKLEQLRPMEHGYKIFVVKTKYDSPEVDTPYDIERIEYKINNM